MNVIRSWKHGTIIYNVHDSWVGRSLNLYGEYSEGEVALFTKLVRANDVVIDVGAHVGVFTMVFARLTAPGGAVLAFEPQRHLYHLLCANVAVNNFRHVYCLNKAAGAATGSIKVPQFDYTNPVNMGLMELDKQWPANIRSEQADVARIDDMGVPSCRLIKVDVEGMEHQVLSGATSLIQKHRPFLYVEDNQPERREKLRELIRGLEYQAWMHRPKVFSPNNYMGNPTNVFGESISENLFCCPHGTPPPISPDDFQMTEIS